MFIVRCYCCSKSSSFLFGTLQLVVMFRLMNFVSAATLSHQVRIEKRRKVVMVVLLHPLEYQELPLYYHMSSHLHRYKSTCDLQEKFVDSVDS